MVVKSGDMLMLKNWRSYVLSFPELASSSLAEQIGLQVFVEDPWQTFADQWRPDGTIHMSSPFHPESVLCRRSTETRRFLPEYMHL